MTHVAASYLGPVPNGGRLPRRPHVLQQEIVFARLFIHPKSAAGLPHGLSLFSSHLRVQIDSPRGPYAELAALVVGVEHEARG